MGNVAEAVRNYEVAKQNIESLLQKQRDLIAKQDAVRENLPRLEHICQEARSGREKVADLVVLGERQKSELTKADERLTEAGKNLETERLLYDAIGRQLKTLEVNLPKKHSEADQLRRKCWEEISNEYEAQISDEIKDIVATVVSIGCQIGRPYQFVLSNLFPNPSNGDIQEIQRNLREQYNLTD